jgi:hypothetical protein
MNARFLMADTVNGVAEIDMVDYPDANFLRFEDFRDSLADLEDGDVVFGTAGPEHFDALDEEYGIR